MTRNKKVVQSIFFVVKDHESLDVEMYEVAEEELFKVSPLLGQIGTSQIQVQDLILLTGELIGKISNEKSPFSNPKNKIDVESLNKVKFEKLKPSKSTSSGILISSSNHLDFDDKKTYLHNEKDEETQLFLNKCSSYNTQVNLKKEKLESIYSAPYGTFILEEGIDILYTNLSNISNNNYQEDIKNEAVKKEESDTKEDFDAKCLSNGDLLDGSSLNEEDFEFKAVDDDSSLLQSSNDGQIEDMSLSTKDLTSELKDPFIENETGEFSFLKWDDSNEIANSDEEDNLIEMSQTEKSTDAIFNDIDSINPTKDDSWTNGVLVDKEKVVKEKSVLNHCHLCDYQSNVKDHMDRHIKTVHEKLKPFQCPKCKFKTSQKHRLKMHIKGIHDKIKDQFCPYCDFESAEANRLKNHVKAIHDQIKDFECSKCEYSTSLKARLQLHEKSVHEEFKEFSCKRCKFQTAIRQRLKNHIDRVHEKIKDFSCGACGKCYGDKHRLKNHIKIIHEKIKDFECEKCDYKTGLKIRLKVHVSSVHDGVKDFSCKQCSFKSATKQRIKNHMMRIHERVKEIPCQYCDKLFTQKIQMQKHVINFHGIV